MRAPGSTTLRNFLVQAVPVFNNRDEVLYWSGHATEVERFADAGTRFISEATAVLSSSLNRATIVNRFIEAAPSSSPTDAQSTRLDAAAALQLEGFTDRRSSATMRAEALTKIVEEALRSRQPLLMLAGTTPAPPADARIGCSPCRCSREPTCVGAAVFFESERALQFCRPGATTSPSSSRASSRWRSKTSRRSNASSTSPSACVFLRASPTGSSRPSIPPKTLSLLLDEICRTLRGLRDRRKAQRRQLERARALRNRRRACTKRPNASSIEHLRSRAGRCSTERC